MLWLAHVVMSALTSYWIWGESIHHIIFYLALFYERDLHASESMRLPEREKAKLSRATEGGMQWGTRHRFMFHGLRHYRDRCLTGNIQAMHAPCFVSISSWVRRPSLPSLLYLQLGQSSVCVWVVQWGEGVISLHGYLSSCSPESVREQECACPAHEVKRHSLYLNVTVFFISWIFLPQQRPFFNNNTKGNTYWNT
jgi:hypothetical protein